MGRKTLSGPQVVAHEDDHVQVHSSPRSFHGAFVRPQFDTPRRVRSVFQLLCSSFERLPRLLRFLMQPLSLEPSYSLFHSHELFLRRHAAHPWFVPLCVLHNDLEASFLYEIESISYVSHSFGGQNQSHLSNE